MIRFLLSTHNINFIAVPDEILIQFEQQTYIVSETGTSQEVCAVPSATPEPGQSVSATLSTVDDSATGAYRCNNFMQHLHITCLQVELTIPLLPTLSLPSHPPLYKDSVSP